MMSHQFNLKLVVRLNITNNHLPKSGGIL